MKRLMLLIFVMYFTIPGLTQDKSYVIKGKIFDIDLNGESIELVELGDGHNGTLQNTRVRNNEFSFTGTVAKPALWMLLIENHRVLLVGENAEISVKIYSDSTRVSGTKSNDDFQDFIDKSNAYRKKITELFTHYQTTPEDSPKKDSLLMQFKDMEKHWHSQVIVKFIENNINNPAGQRAFKSMLPDLSIDELKAIIRNVDSSDIQNPLIQQGIERINAPEQNP